MARRKCIGVRVTLTTLLLKTEIERLAHGCGAVRRARKVDASAMRWSVLPELGTGQERTSLGVRQTYERVMGKSPVPSSLHVRFTEDLPQMFRVVGFNTKPMTRIVCTDFSSNESNPTRLGHGSMQICPLTNQGSGCTS